MTTGYHRDPGSRLALSNLVIEALSARPRRPNDTRNESRRTAAHNIPRTNGNAPAVPARSLPEPARFYG
jgi:hypothetical protein